MLETPKSNQLGRGIYFKVDCFYPRHWIKTSYFNYTWKPLSPLCFYFGIILKDNTIIHISQATANWGKFSDCWICPQKFQSVHESKEPLVLPVTNFYFIPTVTINYNWPSSKVTYRAWFLWPEHPMPCFYPSLFIIGHDQLDSNAYASCGTFTLLML